VNANFARANPLRTMQQNASISFQQIPLGDGANHRADPVTLDIRGDWLYVDALSSGLVRADLYGQVASDVQTLALVGGAVIDRPFTKLRLFWQQMTFANVRGAQVAGGQSVIADAPSIRIFYGVGPCPFQPGTETRGAGLIDADAAPTFSTTLASFPFRVSEGCVLRHAWYSVSGTTLAALPANLIAEDLSFTDANNVALTGTNIASFGQSMPPDVAVISGSGIAAAGTVRIQARWNNIIVPRGAAFAILSASSATALSAPFAGTANVAIG
jgi:hypothetical protein